MEYILLKGLLPKQYFSSRRCPVSLASLLITTIEPTNISLKKKALGLCIIWLTLLGRNDLCSTLGRRALLIRGTLLVTTIKPADVGLDEERFRLCIIRCTLLTRFELLGALGRNWFIGCSTLLVAAVEPAYVGLDEKAFGFSFLVELVAFGCRGCKDQEGSAECQNTQELHPEEFDG
ncbi:hypothetical protein HG530_012472 [Fusarium avenaceum]|nr:hypothetical protein HG530_012472 [Fusarium avenaceum]